MRVHWTDHARRQLRAIHDYIAEDSPLHAARVVDTLTERSRQLRQFPESGRPVPEYPRDDLRELVESPYRLIYRIREHRIDVVSVLHGAQDPPSDV